MIRQPLHLLPLLLVGACPKEAEIIQIPGPHCEIRVAFQAPGSLGQPLRPEGSPNITVLDLELSSENGLQERQLSVVDRSGVLSVAGEPLQIRENEQFTLRITGRSESGDIVSQGQSKSFGCGLDTEQETVNVTVNFLPVNRWIPVSIPNDLARVGHQQVAVGDGLLIVGGRRPSGLATPPSPSDAGVPTQDTGDSSSDAGHSTDGGDPASSGPEAGPTPEAGILDVNANNDVNAYNDVDVTEEAETDLLSNIPYKKMKVDDLKKIALENNLSTPNEINKLRKVELVSLIENNKEKIN